MDGTASSEEEASHLQFCPFVSTVEASFWHKLSHLKLEVYGLQETPTNVRGFYSYSDPPGLPQRVTLDFSAFQQGEVSSSSYCSSSGTVLVKNTLEAFKSCDKAKVLEAQGDELWQDISTGRAITDPTLLSRFSILVYADLKKYQYYYWFAFPAPCYPDRIEVRSVQRIGESLSEKQATSLKDSYSSSEEVTSSGYFLIHLEEEDASFLPLTQLCNFPSVSNIMLGFLDPCTLPHNPGWPLRNLLALVAYHWPPSMEGILRVLCLRVRYEGGGSGKDLGSSLVVSMKLPLDGKPTAAPKFVGWERNERGKFGPRMVNLSANMDPLKLAESSVDLNLKLMKWRLLPTLDLESLKSAKCLLLGAGTLGCGVARCLLGWGVRNITLVDNSRVSYSNPVRQSLFCHQDCLNGGKPKAEAAAQALKDIFPGVLSEGYQLSVPMPGHPVGDSMAEEVERNMATLERLIKSHDAIFLLMDTRESRWLPTVMAASHGKIVINAALGFDTYLVMRHGFSPSSSDDVSPPPESSGSSGDSSKGEISGHMLGCYFCNDVVAPGDSTKDRTLDQQCTVTRPGVSQIAAALAVELFVSLLMHPNGAYASASNIRRDVESSQTRDPPGSGPLGLVPHSIRGFLSQFQTILPACEAFNRCTACSQPVLQEFRDKGFQFVLQALNSPAILEDLTGLTELHQELDNAEVLELSDTEFGDTD